MQAVAFSEKLRMPIRCADGLPVEGKLRKGLGDQFEGRMMLWFATEIAAEGEHHAPVRLQGLRSVNRDGNVDQHIMQNRFAGD